MKELMFGGRTMVIGQGALKSLEKIGRDRVVLVAGGRSMKESGVLSRAMAHLEAAGCVVKVYDGVRPNPEIGDVMTAAAEMRLFNPDMIVAVGGGSAIDAAKVMAMLVEYPELTEDDLYNGRIPEQRCRISLVTIPSTSGTGTEVTKSAVVTFPAKAIKIGLKSPAFIPDVAILDAELTMTMPRNVVAETGMDALTHAVECYINRGLDDYSEILAKGAVTGLFAWLPESYRNGTEESREKVHNYQCMAGMAFANVGLGMAHGIAHAVGGKYGLGHGLINAVVLPEVLRFNSRDHMVAVRLAALAAAVGKPDFISAVRELGQTLGIPSTLRDAGLAEQDFEAGLAELAGASLLGSTRVNPVPINQEEMSELLKRVYYGSTEK